MKKILSSIIGLFCWAVMLTACGGGGGDSGSSGGDSSNGNGGGNTTAPTEIYINIEDAVTGNVWSDVTLKFSGAPVNNDIDGSVLEKTLNADTKKSYKVTTKGLTEKGSVIVTAKALGYMDTGASAVVSPGDDRHEINLKMVKSSPGKVTKGIYTAEMDISPYLDEDGKTTEKIELTSKDLTNSNEPGPGVSISIPKDTILYTKDDDDGNKVVVTSGTLRVTSFDPYTPEAQAAFPGGFNVIADAENFVDHNGVTHSDGAEIDFKSAGFAAISIESDSGQKVKTFSKDATISMEVRDGTTDPKGNPVVTSTPIPVWSYDEETGRWAYENESPASSMTGVKGGFGEVKFDTNHLTYWNLDWHYGPKCNPRFLFLLPNDQPNTTTDLKFRLTVDSNPSIIRNFHAYQKDGFLQLYNVPAGVPGSLEIFSANGSPLQTIDVDNFCEADGSGSIIRTVISPEIKTSQISMDFACPGGGPIPGQIGATSVPFEALLNPVNAPFSTALMPNGTGEVALLDGTTQDYNVIPSHPGQATLYAAIADQSTTSINIVAGQDFSRTFLLTNSFCTGGPIGFGTINGEDTNNINSNVCGLPGDTDSDTSKDNNRPRAMDVARDSHGNLYFSVWDPIAGTGSIQRFSGNGVPEIVISGDSNSAYPNYTPTVITGSGVNGTNIKTKRPMGLDIHSSSLGDVLYYADFGAHCVNAILLSTSQVVSVAGKCGEHGNQPNDHKRARVTEVNDVRLRNPADVAADNSGYNLFITDYVNRKVRMVGSDPVTNRLPELLFNGDAYLVYMKTLAGSILPSQGNPAPNPSTPYTDGDSALGLIPTPGGIAVAPNGTVVITGGNMVTRIENISSTTGDNEPQNQSLKRVAGMYNIPGGGPGINGGVGDGGPAINAKLTLPIDVEIDIAGNILVSDQSEHRVKRINVTTGIIDTVAGSGNHSWAVTCGIPTQQTTSNPRGIWSEFNSGSPFDFDFTQYGNVPNVIRQVRYP